jgi:hypothetical protein
MGGPVLAVVGSGVFLDLARQNLGDGDRGCYGVGGPFSGAAVTYGITAPL